MVVNKVWAVYFSATGTTKKVVEEMAGVIAEKLGVPHETYDFTLSLAREGAPDFKPDDLVVFGTPVYAGRVPNVLLKYLETIRGNGAAAVPVVLYGNRDYDDALIELRDILEKDGFHPVAAAAFIGEHSFSYILAKGRPDELDLQKAVAFAADVAKKMASMMENADGTPGFGSVSPIEVKGTPEPYRGYYQPRDRKGEPVDIRKVKPLTKDNCNDCKICADTCPMGSISREDVKEYTGICIKCGACIKNCPLQAKYYEDAGYLYHQHELEEGLTRRAEPEWFL